MIGAADEFWRLRITKVDTTEELDFEWHDDILYREPTAEQADEVELWHVEAVSTGADETVVRIRTFRNRGTAQDFIAAANEALLEMTKTQFEAAYLASAEVADNDGATE